MWGKEKRKGKGKEKELVCPGAGQQHQDPVTEMQAPHLPHAATDRSGGGAGLLILIIMVIISNVNVTVSVISTSLLLPQVQLAEWDKASSLRELDITATDLSTAVIQDILTRCSTSHRHSWSLSLSRSL